MDFLLDDCQRAPHLRDNNDLLLDSPVESVEGENAQLGVVFAVRTISEEKFGELGDELAEKGDFLWNSFRVARHLRLKSWGTHEDEKGFKYVEELTRAGLIATLDRLADDRHDRGQELLERFLHNK